MTEKLEQALPDPEYLKLWRENADLNYLHCSLLVVTGKKQFAPEKLEKLLVEAEIPLDRIDGGEVDKIMNGWKIFEGYSEKLGNYKFNLANTPNWERLDLEVWRGLPFPDPSGDSIAERKELIEAVAPLLKVVKDYLVLRENE